MADDTLTSLVVNGPLRNEPRSVIMAYAALVDGGPGGATEISERTDYSRVQISRAIGRLIDIGLAERTHGRGDARSPLVRCINDS